MSTTTIHHTRTRVARGVAAVAAGLVTTAVLSSAVDAVLEATGVFPSVTAQTQNGFITTWMVLLAVGYRTLLVVVGGYVTARLAPTAPMRHAVVLGLIGTAAAVAGAVAVAGVAPLWYSMALVVTGLPGVLLGARLATVTSRA